MATDFLKSVLASFFSENELNLHLSDYQSFMSVGVVKAFYSASSKLSDAISEAVRDEL